MEGDDCMTIDQHLDNVFTKAAQDFERRCNGVLYQYEYYNSDIMSPKLLAKGTGYIISARYDRGLDCDVYVLLDKTTGARHVGNQFRFVLEEVK